MLQSGTIIEAKLIEAVEKDRWIVSFQGHLLQVKNTTAIKFEAGKVLQLKIEKLNPIQLRILSPRHYRSSLDLIV